MKEFFVFLFWFGFVMMAAIIVFVGLPKVSSLDLWWRTEVPIVVSRPEVRMSYVFPGGSVGYRLIEGPVADSIDVPNLSLIDVLIGAAAYEEYQQNPAESAILPTFSILVFDEAVPPHSDDRLTHVQNWIEQQKDITQVAHAKKKPKSVNIAGESMLFYQIIGDYDTDMYVASFEDNVYVFIGQYDSKDRRAKADFVQVVESVVFQ